MAGIKKKVRQLILVRVVFKPKPPTPVGAGGLWNLGSLVLNRIHGPPAIPLRIRRPMTIIPFWRAAIVNHLCVLQPNRGVRFGGSLQKSPFDCVILTRTDENTTGLFRLSMLALNKKPGS